MAENKIVVDVKQLSRFFGDFAAVDRISFQVGKGEIFGFLGANGAGKTTTIRMLCGLLMPTSGIAKILDYDLYRNVEAIKRRIGYMSQKFSLYYDLTVLENIQFYGRVYGMDREMLKTKTEALLRYLNLKDQAHQLTAGLPLGWKQRLALSCALLHDPELVFLDEPTSGVDPVSRRQFWLLIYELAKAGKTVFVTTHYMDEAAYCHRISIMKDGRIVALDTPKRLLAQFEAEDMETVFIRAVKGGRL